MNVLIRHSLAMLHVISQCMQLLKMHSRHYLGMVKKLLCTQMWLSCVYAHISLGS